MAFLDIEFPRDVAAGVSGGPEWRVDVAQLASGFEERNLRWADSRRSFQAGLGIRSADDLQAVAVLFEQARGMFHSFRFRDWSDFKSCAPSGTPAATDQEIGTGDGATVTFRLARSYGAAAPYRREITKPVAGSVLIALGGVAQGAGWSVDHATGLVTFTIPPASGTAISAGFLFDVPVRFDAPRLTIDMRFFEGTADGIGELPDVPLVEVRE